LFSFQRRESMQANNQSVDKTARAAKPARLLDPEKPELVMPYKEFVGRGWMTYSLTGNKLSTTLTCEVPEAIAGKGKPCTGLSASEAKALIVEAKLWVPKGPKDKADKNKSAPAKPKKTLVPEDFKEGPEAVKKRATEVAGVLTATVAKGRIGSLKLMIEDCDDFESWWQEAESKNKLRLFMDGKHLAKLSDDHINGFSTIMGKSCPFRGSVPTPSPEEEEDNPGAQAPGSPRKK
jgi:hypothetical protein